MPNELKTGETAEFTLNDVPWNCPKKFAVPNLSNATVGYLVDEVGRIRKMMAYLKDADAFMSEALKARLKGDAASGDKFDMTRSASSQTRISPDLCREHLTPELLEKVTVSLSITQMRFTKKPTATPAPGAINEG